MTSAVDTLAPYQNRGVEFLAPRPVAFLLDQQGLGKTPQAIRAADHISAETITVLCPAIGRVMWQRAFGRWATKAHKVTVKSYDEAVAIKPQALACDLLILDEAQYLKNQTAQRTRAVYGHLVQRKNCIAQFAEMVWLLSGTLTPNGGQELYTHLRALLPELIQRDGAPLLQWQFEQRYFHTVTDMRTRRVVVRGARAGALTELHGLLRPHYLRRLKRDVLPELPPLRTEVAVLPVAQPGYTPEQQALIEAATAAMAQGSDVDAVPLSTIRRMTGLAKVGPALEYIQGILDGGEPKVVVFAHHRDVIEALRGGLAEHGAVVLWGGLTDKQKQTAIDGFQSDPRVRVLVGQITACNAVIDLSAAAREVFVEFSFVPGENAQAAERCHRFTTVNPVLASFLTLEGSLDEAMTRIVERKTAAIAALWKDENVTTQHQHRSRLAG
ncbi:MAG: DEAD/DEAH box helicase [Gammaproteobacteria bacterium PRO9]|nr:DEAD/DEAH box helicase [Gammaproteobacteria bacterium PRO9]